MFLVQIPLNSKPTELVSWSLPVGLAGAATLESVRRVRGAQARSRDGVYGARAITGGYGQVSVDVFVLF